MPSTDWKESSPPGEAERFEGYAQALGALQQRYAKGGPPARGLHAKGQLGLEAEFEVLPDLPEHARVALFAQPRTYKAYVRYSNGAGRRQSDRMGDVRGVAVKLVGVEGAKLIPGMESALTQDLLLIRAPNTPFRNADEFVPFALAIGKPATALPKLLLEYGPLRLWQILSGTLAGLKLPMASLATTRYYSAVPVQLGPYAVHYALTPRTPADPNARGGASPDYLGEELAARLRQGPVAYDFQLQFYEDPVKTPIEDASVEWREADAPFITVGRLTVKQQDIASPRGQKLASWVETLSFDPWHALKELRPLGNIMRARNAAYRVSTTNRKAAPEPDGSESFD